jgi:hypothetical protein
LLRIKNEEKKEKPVSCENEEFYKSEANNDEFSECPKGWDNIDDINLD